MRMLVPTEPLTLWPRPDGAAIALTIAMMAVYFGFILLVAFDKPLLGTLMRRA